MYLPLKRGTFRISSGFGMRWGTMHNGLDFAAPVGTPIYAPFDMKIIQGKDRAPGSVTGFSNWVWGEGVSEPYDFIVGHMKHSSILVQSGDFVKAGQKIAEVGSEGQSTGPHAHCELWTRPGRLGGRPIDPAPFWGGGAKNPGEGSTVTTAVTKKKGRDYLRVEPDLYALLPSYPARFTRGRRAKIEYITRHHTAGKLDAAGINRVWRDREASAHYLVDPTGRISQHVNDVDTAWSNASAYSNARSISIEHSNDGGFDWSISDETIVNGARWAAALCLFYGLGRPVYGRNIRDHKEFSGTSCPYHLAKGGKYHDRWMAESQRFYDELSARKAGKKPTEEKGGESVTFKQFTDFIKGYFGPQIDALQEVWTQLRGPGGRGWAQLGVNERGEHLTLVDGVAALRQDVAELSKKIDLMGEK